LQCGEGVSARILRKIRRHGDHEDTTVVVTPPAASIWRSAVPPCAPIAAWEIDRKACTARRILTDGTSEPALPLRELFEQYFDETVGKHGNDGAMVDVKTRRCAWEAR
jgi:hypothetical protein